VDIPFQQLPTALMLLLLAILPADVALSVCSV